jgi:Aldehyde dehydrogenase family
MNALATPPTAIDQAIDELQVGALSLVNSTLAERIRVAEACISGIAQIAQQWCQAGTAAKQTGDSAAGRAEEIFGGPLAAIRFLRLTVASLRDIEKYGQPQLPGKIKVVDGQVRVPVFPTGQLFDRLVFQGLKAECWLQPDVTPDNIFGTAPLRLQRTSKPEPHIALVLGAGNVAAIPITDALTKIFHDDCVVLLKMNPVNEYLGPIFEKLLRPLIVAGWLRIIYGAGAVGAYACHHSRVQSIHITGSTDTHELIVWGTDPTEREKRKLRNSPLLSKPISSELGNVTPWIIVPGDYSQSELRAQVESIAASVINNASFNCIATKMIVTCRQWPQRQQFIEMLGELLKKTPARYAYYPGAAGRYEEFSGQSTTGLNDRLPWCFKPDLHLDDEPLMFQKESFVCVLGETSIGDDSDQKFLEEAVEFVNERISGTLAVGLTVPNSFSRRQPQALDNALRKLRYGTIGINQWSALGFAWMSTHWGGFPGASLADVQSGIGSVHNTYLLNRPQKSVIWGKLKLFPRPVWFSSHACPDKVAQRLLDLYCRPSLLRLPFLFASALRG